MKLGKSIDVYVSLITQASKTTWTHKEWWIIAALAGLANTGGVFSSVFHTFWRLRPADVITPETIVDVFPFVGWLMAYVRNLVTLSPQQQGLSIGLLAFIIAVLFLIVITSQHLLLCAVKKGHGKTQPFSRQTFRKHLSHLHLARLFAVNAFFVLALSLLVTGSAIPLSLLLTDDTSINVFLYAGIYAIILPLAFFVSVIGILTLISISQKNLSLRKALHEGLLLTHRHWLGALELSLILFFINLVASLVLFVCLFIVTIAVGLVFELAFIANAYLMMSVITFVGVLLAGAVMIIYAGAITMLNYSAWSAFAKRVGRTRHIPIVDQLVENVFVR